MSRSFKVGVLAAAVMAVAPAAQAFEAGNFVVRGGAVHVAPDDSSDSITLGGNPLLSGADSKVTVDSNTQLGIRATYMFTENLGLGILAATPFKHDINGGGDLSSDLNLGETKHLPPTITLQYFPMSSSSKFQPYAGIGINYTVFFEEKTSDTLTGAVADEYKSLGNVTGTSLDLDDSVGVAVELGMDYMLSDNFGLNAALWWADINTDATVTADFDNGTSAKTDEFEVEIDPMVYMIGMTYKF
ncbi:outer membrane protein [Marinobacter persicus]|uniref:Outer membrane protein n=1 Tax=Marinobacter persicus TaxID=930118 RepID=A0A1I3XP08_9GAMM|nr:OmpW family outer membrane protein [Marinobacter persicus]GHD49601.1 outer membrane protein W [Marinobacter persicus]SFK21284.1 outer membrane protein [Marinobacter persicus]